VAKSSLERGAHPTAGWREKDERQQDSPRHVKNRVFREPTAIPLLPTATLIGAHTQLVAMLHQHAFRLFYAGRFRSRIALVGDVAAVAV